MFSAVAAILFTLSPIYPAHLTAESAVAAAAPNEVVASVASYMAFRSAQDIASYISAREAAEAAQQALEAPVQPSPARTGGGHSDAWWQGVAICEQGGRNDPYFGYFSFMNGSQGGRPWAEQVAAGNALLAQYPERESQGGAWADSCIDAGYAASPGG